MRLAKIVLLIFFYSYQPAAYGQLVDILKTTGNVLYIGMDNDLNYLLKRYDTSVVDFKASFGRLSYYYEYNQMIWRSCSQADDSLIILMFNKKTDEIMDAMIIKTSLLPDPSIVVPKGKHALYWGKRALYENKVVAEFNAPKFKFKCKILSFLVQLQKPNQPLREYDNIGDRYTDEAIELMKEFEKGDIAYFTEFNVKCGCEEQLRVLKEKLMFEKVSDVIRVERQAL